jgi:hypothetical protein
VCSMLSDQPANDIAMDSIEATSHPFIVRIWLEETPEEAGKAVWRGHITHVPSGDRCYFENLDTMSAFVGLHLERMGVRFGLWWRIRRWLSR